MLYSSYMDIIANYQQKVLKLLSGKIEGFYLAGGTALSLYYFNHRLSVDLDFFTHDFKISRVEEIAGLISSGLKKNIKLITRLSDKDKAQVLVYSLDLGRGKSLKIDFVHDFIKFIKAPKLINGVNILSLEDLYLRKLSAILGHSAIEDDIGRKVARGGRQEAKDFYDLYCLSQIFMRLSDFAGKYGSPLIRAPIIRWFRSYKRFDMKTGLLELGLKKDVDFNDIERHFKREVDKIIEKEVG